MPLENATFFKSADHSKHTCIHYKDGSSYYWGTESRVPAYGWSASTMGHEPDPPDSPRTFSYRIDRAGRNLLTAMMNPMQEAVLGFYEYSEILCSTKFLSDFELKYDGRPIEFDGLPYGSWHEVMLFVFDQVKTVWANEFFSEWIGLGDVSWVEFQEARAAVIYSHRAEAQKLIQEELEWEWADVARVWHYLKFERKQMGIDEPPPPDGTQVEIIKDPITRAEISILSRALSPGNAKDEKTVYNRFPHKNGPVPFVKNGGSGAASYSVILSYLKEAWSDIAWPERYKEALATIRSQVSNRE